MVYEIDLSTNMLIGIDDNQTRVITYDKDFVVKASAKEIMEQSCKFFGSKIDDRVSMTKRLINITSKVPIVIEESRNIIFFPLKSVRDKCNIWISFNNLESYIKKDEITVLKFKNKKTIELDFSYYIIDNQVTRSLMLDYEIKKRRESLEK